MGAEQLELWATEALAIRLVVGVVQVLQVREVHVNEALGLLLQSKKFCLAGSSASGLPVLLQEGSFLSAELVSSVDWHASGTASSSPPPTNQVVADSERVPRSSQHEPGERILE